MAKLEITDRHCRAKAPPGGQLEFIDTLVKGLCLRITPGRDTRAWRFHYRRAGKRCFKALGYYPDISLVRARELAKECRTALAAGIDPGAPPEPVNVMTVSDLIESYCARHADTKRTGPKIRRRLTKNIGGVIGGVKLSALHRRDMTRCLDIIMTRGKPTEAVRVFQDARAMCRWAARRGDIDTNPMADQRPPAESRVRNRWLTADEIAAFWAALPDAHMSEGVRNCLRLALVTAQRIGEISGMCRAELDLENRLWVIPGARTKNGREHRLPLSDFAIEIIKAQWDQRSDYVFPGRRGQPHLLSGGISHAVQRYGDEPGAAKQTLGLPHFVAHDLRRSAATHMEELGISPFIISVILNHVSETRAGVTGRHYRHYDYSAEKRAALDAWAARLTQIIDQPNKRGKSKAQRVTHR